MSIIANASADTAHASRYLKQLAKHWSHRLDVEFDSRHARITFPNGTVAVLDADDTVLRASLDAPDRATLEQMTKVLIEHLDRFAFREAPLPFVWQFF